MKNYVLLFVTTCAICAFWQVIYYFGNQSIAAYLSAGFGLISVLTLSWIVIQAVFLVRAKTEAELEKFKKRALVKKTLAQRS